MIWVGIVDDHPISRWGIHSVLSTAPGIAVVAASETPDMLPADKLDVVTLDLFLADDLPCLDRISELAARTRVLVITASNDAGDVRACFRAGAGGYLHKQAGRDELVLAVRTVAAGGAVRPQTDPAPAGGSSSLSPREQQVLRYIAGGYTHDQTARRLGVSRHTVDTYVKRLRVKLGRGNKADLTRAALRISAVAGHGVRD